MKKNQVVHAPNRQRSSCSRVLARVVGVGALAVGALAPSTALAITDNYCSFPTLLTTWTYNGNAFEAQDSLIRMSDNVNGPETSSAFQTIPVPLLATSSLHAYFRFNILPNAAGGDGVAFILQNSTAGATALGAGGYGMGYVGISPSVIIEFDTFKNVPNADPDSNHVALMLNGSTVHTVHADPTFTMADGGILSAWVDYVPGTISVYLAQTPTKPTTALFSTAVNLFTTLGSQAYVGFAAATNGGAGYIPADAGATFDGGGNKAEVNQQDIYELEVSTDGVPCFCEGDSACTTDTGNPACLAAGICGICSATNSTACTGATPVCDVPTASCVGCLTSADCSSGTPICNAGTHTCRACMSNTDCGGVTPECDTIAGSANLGNCVACVADKNCPPTSPRCTTANTCVQCITGADCGGDTPVCDGSTCVACATDADCSGSTPACQVSGACGQCSSTNSSQCVGADAVCDFPSGTCVGCEFNSDCSGNTPTCDRATHTCGPCQSDADCVGNLGGPSCVLSGMKQGSCVVCTQNSDCTSAGATKCDTTANLCVQCLVSTDCSAPTPVCNSSNLCVGCLSDTDCAGTPAAPICNPTSSTCAGCQNDYSATNPGQLSCPSATMPACQATGSNFAGQCLVCSGSNNSLCVTQPTTPVCIATSAICGCAADTDCLAGFYCDTTSVSTGVCTMGCRVVNGTTNCSTGEYCTSTTSAVGACMTEPCNSDADCTAPNGVCNTILQPHVCVACLNASDCTVDGGSPMVCDTTMHCAQCTTTQTQNCTAAGSGSACLANETCGCATDVDCGGAASGRVCNSTTNSCEAGCRGAGGNTCPAGQTCSSTTNTPGVCSGGVSSSASSASASGSSSASSSGAGGGAVTKPNLTIQSTGCGCSVVGSDADLRMTALACAAFAAALARRRKRA